MRQSLIAAIAQMPPALIACTAKRIPLLEALAYIPESL